MTGAATTQMPTTQMGIGERREARLASVPVSRRGPEVIEGQRVSWRLSPAGTFAACTVVTVDGHAVLEVRGGGGRRVFDVPHLSVQSQLLPDDDGTVLLCHHRLGVHQIESVSPTGVVTRLATTSGASASLVRTPAGVLVLETTGTAVTEGGPTSPSTVPGTSIARLEARGLVSVAAVHGRAVGAVALDGEGELLALNVVHPGHGGEAIEVDLRTGSSRPLLSIRPTSADQVVDHRGAVVVVSTTALGAARIGYGRPGSEPVRFPDALAGPDGSSHLATSADGTLVAVAVEHGATTQIRLLDTTTGQVSTPRLGPLVVIGRGHLDRDRLVVPVSTPDHSGTLLRLDLATGQHAFDDPPVTRPVRLRVITLPGATDPIECVVVGDPVRTNAVVIALHGGPLDAWRAHHDPLLAALAAAGIAVVAPNVRGSTGYGPDHALAIRGQWGGPDLDDVRAVAAHLRARRGNRPQPIVLGHSYGAWLAVLAAAAEPHAWSGCVAVSAFVSGRRVVETGGPVAALVARLDGLSAPNACTSADAITCPTLVLHGTQDTVVPPSEGRRLAASLAPGVGRLVELPACGHDVFTSGSRLDALEQVVTFIRHSSRRK